MYHKPKPGSANELKPLVMQPHVAYMQVSSFLSFSFLLVFLCSFSFSSSFLFCSSFIAFFCLCFSSIFLI